MLLEEESDADVSRPWHDLLVSGNPGELSPVARVQLPQELGLVEVGGSWDDSVGLPDNLVSGPGLQGQRRLWHLLEPVYYYNNDYKLACRVLVNLCIGAMTSDCCHEIWSEDEECKSEEL